MLSFCDITILISSLDSILAVINSFDRLISNDDGPFDYYEPELFASVSSISNIRFPFPDSGPLREQVWGWANL